MDGEEIRELRAVLGRLKQEHRDLDSAINALEQSGRADALQLNSLMTKSLFSQTVLMARVMTRIAAFSSLSVTIATARATSA